MRKYSADLPVKIPIINISYSQSYHQMMFFTKSDEIKLDLPLNLFYNLFTL